MNLLQRRLILIGMPGSGKSYWAHRLAAGWEGVALDLDMEITRISGKSIPQIFTEKGEAGFRKLESEVLQEVLLSPNWDFLATGGGTPCYFGNLEKLKAAGTVVYLKACLPLLVSRIQAEVNTRPLLAGFGEDELLEKLSQLLAAREPFYQRAHHTISVEGLTEATFAAL